MTYAMQPVTRSRHRAASFEHRPTPPLLSFSELDVGSQTPLLAECSLRTLQALACTCTTLCNGIRAWLTDQPRVHLDVEDVDPAMSWYAHDRCMRLKTLVIGGREWELDPLRSASKVKIGGSAGLFLEEAIMLAPFVTQNASLASLVVEGENGTMIDLSQQWLSSMAGRSTASSKHDPVPTCPPPSEVSLVSSALPQCSLVFASALLKHNPCARRLRACDAGVDACSVRILVHALEHNTHLHALNLSQNDLGDAGCELLAAALMRNTKLRRLVLQANGIGPGGGRVLGGLLAASSSLVDLDLWGNLLGCEGTTPIARGLVTNTTLRTLNLRSNRVGDAGATSLGAALRENRTLRTLLLSWNRVGDLGAAALAEGLSANCALRELNLLENYVDDAGARALRSGLQTNSTLSCCSLQCNLVQGAMVADLEAWLASIHRDDPAPEAEGDTSDGSSDTEAAAAHEESAATEAHAPAAL